MKKIFLFSVITVLAILLFATCVYAQPGKIGFFGGITEGTRLSKTTEQLIAVTAKKNSSVTVPYKELVFLTGKPIEYTGTLTIKTSASQAGELGTIKVTYTVAASSGAEKETIARTIVFNVNYRKDGGQTVYDYESASWTETINAGGTLYRAVPSQSHFSISLLEDDTPGVDYFKGDLSSKTVYTIAGAGSITVESAGTIYGYDSAWSNTETHRIDTTIDAGDWQLQYQIRPSVSVSKTLQYSQNEPTAISFDGNYREVMSNQSGLSYDIFALPLQFEGIAKSGQASISTYNSFEQLTAPDLTFLKGHEAESDIKKLFAMGILDGVPSQYVPGQAVTRGQFVTMLVKAIKLPIEQPPVEKNSKKTTTIYVTFPDVTSERPDYPYIMAAYKSGIAVGRGNGHFYVDYPLQKEEAYTIMIKALGLMNLGLNPQSITQYADNNSIADWAKQSITAGTRIGIIMPDAEGRVNPKEYLTKAEAAAIINRIVEYLRTDIQLDYTEHIVNYTY